MISLGTNILKKIQIPYNLLNFIKTKISFWSFLYYPNSAE